ncbi:UbiA family prenyltransferase [Micromonospora coxensis]|uniref:4-hydroxybenzoate polyprenyltransferase n=1 Tax=Micromonospora coxensis TaxID=356852 RepID=A0A1C5IK73_9ACTN|nr:UbiA family prenyltransferase [Micromonospora coxensis]SCG58216.1 4-hydroxybenzoate polyprenyltransferase [Micromonospora coxensis]
MSSTVLGLVRASHLEPTVAVTVVAGLLAHGVGHAWPGVAAVAATVLASQLATGWTNDALDAGRDAAVGRTDKPVAAGAVRRRTVAVAAAVAATATPLLALTTNPVAALWATVGLLSALLYDWPLKSSPVSVLPYAVSFGALPAFVVLALPGAPAPPAWLVVAAALLGAGAHFANVLPDLADDARTGVRGLPHRLGPAGSRVAAAGLLLAATVALVVGPPGPPSWLGWSAVAVAAVVPPLGWYGGRAATRAGGRPVAVFRAVMVVALIDVVLLVASGRVV